MAGKPTARQVYRRILPVYRTHARFILVAALIVFVPLGALDALQGSVEDAELDDLSGVEVAGLALVLLAHAGTALVGEVFYSAVVVSAVAAYRAGHAPRLGVVARELPYLRLLIVDVVFSVAVAVGFLLLIVPGLILFTWFALAGPLVELEHRGVRAGFARSRELVRGSFWTAFAVLIPIAIVTDSVAEALAGESVGVLGDSFAGHWLASVITALVGNPLYAVAAAVLTFALLEREAGRAEA